MGFFDKVKNMFTEEVEEDEVKVQQIKKEVKHVPIESPKGEKPINEEYNFNNNMSFSKPVFFDEDDFDDLDLVEKKEEPKIKLKKEPKIEIKKEEIKEEQKPMYSGNSVVEKEETKVFKPTPIISPVYGILDKNYHKEDIVDRTETTSYVNHSEDSIDKVREKAYGTLEDELENTLFGNSILFKKEEEELDQDEVEIDEIDEDSISSLTEDVGKELDELLENKKKKRTVKGKKTEKKIKDDDEDEDEDLLGFIDSTLYKDGDEE